MPISSRPITDPLLSVPTGSLPLRAPRMVPRAASAGFPGAEFPERAKEPVPGEPQMPPWRRRRRGRVAGVEQDELLDPEALADHDSRFCELNGIRVHHKICDQELDGAQVNGGNVCKIGLPVVLLHGFGASVFSWGRVMPPMARLTGSRVLAFDRPAFGLTARAGRPKHISHGGDDTKQLNPYSMAFSVMATLAFIDMLDAGKAILVGHSAGCLVAVNAYFQAPERVAALVLIAPAILAPMFARKAAKENGVDKGEEQRMMGNSDNDGARGNPIVRIWRAFLELCMRIAGCLAQMLRAMRDMAGSLYCKALAAVLRSTLAVLLVRMIIDKFGILAVRNAWYDGSQVTDHVIQGYTKPLKAKGWDIALLEYTIAMITDSTPGGPISERLSKISCPVLVVTGDTDRLVPPWNAERVAQAIPGASFEVIKNCGHLPQEERAEEFLSVIGRFLQKVFGAPNKQMFQAAA